MFITCCHTIQLTGYYSASKVENTFALTMPKALNNTIKKNSISTVLRNAVQTENCTAE